MSNNLPYKAIDLFYKVFKLSEFIFSIFFEACGQLGNTEGLNLGKKFTFNYSLNIVDLHAFIVESILKVYTKCIGRKSAESFFDKIDRDVISCGSMMKRYNICDAFEKTLALFERMKNEKIEPDDIILTLLVDACSQAGDRELCRAVVRQILLKLLSNP